MFQPISLQANKYFNFPYLETYRNNNNMSACAPTLDASNLYSRFKYLCKAPIDYPPAVFNRLSCVRAAAGRARRRCARPAGSPIIADLPVTPTQLHLLIRPVRLSAIRNQSDDGTVSKHRQNWSFFTRFIVDLMGIHPRNLYFLFWIHPAFPLT